MYSFVLGDGSRTLLKIWILMDFSFQRDVEMLRRMVNGLQFGHSFYFPHFFSEDHYGFQRFFDDMLFDLFPEGQNSRQRRHNSRLARSLVDLEQLLYNEVDHWQRRNPRHRHRSRINITLQPPPPANQLSSHLDHSEPSQPIETEPLCGSTENNASDIEICAICREKFKERDNIRQLPCEHLFHPDCVRPWLQRRNTCPTCRQRL